MIFPSWRGLVEVISLMETMILEGLDSAAEDGRNEARAAQLE
jgi:hypothetical protein